MIELSVFITIILSIINLLLLILVLIINNGVLFYVIYTLITYLIIKKIYIKYLIAYKEIPLYLYLFLPGLGPILVAIIIFSLNFFLKDSTLISDYEIYIRFKNQINSEKSFNYIDSIKTMSALDYMNYLTPDAKKELIVIDNNNLTTNKIKVLKRGNRDFDTEVQHYSAVSLNSIENKMNDEINELHSKFNNTNDSNILKKLINTYKEYIESSLLERESLMIFNDEYIKLIKKFKNMTSEDLDINIDLMRAYLRKNNFESAFEIYTNMVKEYEYRIEPYLLKVELDYIKKDYTNLNKDIALLTEKSNTLVVPKEYSSKIKFWTK